MLKGVQCRHLMQCLRINQNIQSSSLHQLAKPLPVFDNEHTVSSSTGCSVKTSSNLTSLSRHSASSKTTVIQHSLSEHFNNSQWRHYDGKSQTKHSSTDHVLHQGAFINHNLQRLSQFSHGATRSILDCRTGFSKNHIKSLYGSSASLCLNHHPCITTNSKHSLRHCSSIASPTPDGALFWDFPPVVAMQHFMESVHDYSHLPWWGTIILTTLLFRTCMTLPIAMYAGKKAAQIELLMPTVSMMNEAVLHNVTVRCKREGKTAEEANSEYQKEIKLMIRDLYAREKIQIWKQYALPWIQIPLFVCISYATRNMCGFVPAATNAGQSFVLCPEMMNEGILWFSDLTVPDPYFILPVLLGAVNLTLLQLHVLIPREMSTVNRIIHSLLKGLSITMMVVATQIPAAMSLYWTVSASYGLTQNILIKYPFVRRKLGIPKTPSESTTPLRDMNELIRRKAGKYLQIQRQGRVEQNKEDIKKDVP